MNRRAALPTEAAQPTDNEAMSQPAPNCLAPQPPIRSESAVSLKGGL